MRKNILFDLDGTLTDPKDGILGCIRYALEKSGRNAPPIDELLWCIGPPLHFSFAELVPGISADETQRLIAFYRERFGPTGKFENRVYDGIPELLASLTGARRLFLATSKPHTFARDILVHFGLAQYFHGIYGSELDGTRSEKADLISYILAKEKISPADALIVGDRKFDVIGAKKTGILSVGITWGYGSAEELREAGADFVFGETAELGRWLLESG